MSTSRAEPRSSRGKRRRSGPGGQDRCELRGPGAPAVAGEPVHDRHPGAAGRGDVHAVAEVPRGVGHVDGDGVDQVLLGRPVLAGVRGGDGLDGLRQRGVTGGERVVVVEDPPPLFGAEPIREQDRRQHHIGLLDDLMAVDHQRVVVEEQGIALRWRPGEVPRRLVEEAVVLEVHADRFVVRDVHLVGRLPPLRHLVVGEPRALDHRWWSAGASARARSTASAARRRFSAAIRLVNRLLLTTVEYSSGPVTLLMTKRPPWRSQKKPSPAHIRAVSTSSSTPCSEQQLRVAGHPDVLVQRVGDVGVDVVLRGAGGVVGGRLMAVDRAPREQGSGAADLLRARRRASGSMRTRCMSRLRATAGDVWIRNGRT